MDKFPDKVLTVIEANYWKMISEAIGFGKDNYDLGTYSEDLEFTPKTEYARYTNPTMASTFLPIISSGTNTDAVILTPDGYNNPIWKINVPGFIYRRHFKGSWSASTNLRLLVGGEVDTTGNVQRLSGKVYEYINSSGGSSNNHACAMTPINPGTKTYLMVVGQSTTWDNEKILFLPAENSKGYSNVVNLINSDSSVPVVTSSRDDIEGFVKIFER